MPYATRQQRPPSAAAQLARGLASPARAANLLLTARGVKPYAVLPLLANGLIYAIVMTLFIVLIAHWQPQVGAWEFWGPTGRWLANALNFTLGPLKWIVAIPTLLVFCYFTFTIVGFIVAAPFNDMLAARVERAICHPRLRGREGDERLPLMLTGRLMLLTMWDSLLIVARQLAWTAATLPLLVIPIVGFIPFFLVTAYFTGLGFFDTSMARNNLRNRHKAPVLRVHRWELLGLGAAMELLFMIPFAGLLLLPLGVTAGTILYCEIDWDRALRENGNQRPPGFTPPEPA
jgi:CysZ protein